jgi:methionyl-tRNA synthetase
MSNPKRYLITSALPYASGTTHLGNIVGSTLPADIYSRYCRLRGRDTLHVCGSDEHGVAITIAAEKEGLTPKELIDRVHATNAKGLASISIEFDYYGRTSSQIHHQTAQEFFSYWLEHGLLEVKTEDQFYDADAGMFLPDRYVEGICPNCGNDKARGDQCDNCGAYYNQLDLRSPRSLLSGKPPSVRQTSHWYFDLPAFQQFCEEYLHANENGWKDNVVQQTKSWLQQGLAKRPVTRDMQWGVPIPVPDTDGKVMYVWFEAVLGYISITKEWAQQQGIPDDWKRWWLDSDTRYTAFLGKDNIVFHTIIFPIVLHSRKDFSYVLPTNIPANEFLNLEGSRFSKSRNWNIDIVEFGQRMPNAQHHDVLRYVLTMNMPETRDSDFSWRDYQARNNNELAAILGNYIHRVLQFVTTRFSEGLPERSSLVHGEHEAALLHSIETGCDSIAKHYDNFRFRDAATETMNVVRAANKYFNDKAPWKNVSDNLDDCVETLHVCLCTAERIATLIAPILPATAKRIQRMLSVAERAGGPQAPPNTTDYWQECKSQFTPWLNPLQPPSILFARFEDEDVQKQVEHLHAMALPQQQRSAANIQPQPSEAPVEPGQLISIDDVKKIELRTARVVHAEPVPKSKKLLRLEVLIGQEKRQILAGIAQHYNAEELIGKLVVVVANLKPATLMGLESNGMILAASNSDGMLTLIEPNDSAIDSGAEVR